MRYPKFETLHITPDFLTFGASAMRALYDAGWAIPIVQELTTEERAEYQQLHSEKRHGWLKSRFGGRRIA